MALLPCDFGPHRNLGRNISFYSSIGSGSFMERRSWRLCPRHWQEIEGGLAKFKVDPTSGALSSSIDQGLCLSCSEPVNELGRQLFVTCYPSQNNREDYWSRIHDDCSLPESWPKPEWGR
jgi:hypothetical protein